jgi:hypothetical protein
MRFNARMEPVARRILAPASVALASLLSFGSAADGFARDTDGSARDGQAIRAEPRPRVQRIAILPDRTTGRDWGLPYLDAAAEDLNVVRPDAIFNVGDMIQGYTSDPARWEREATEYLERVGRIAAPFYPTAGNHDVISGTRVGGDDTFARLYRRRFGPLWYSVDLDLATVLVLFSDEALDGRSMRVGDAQLAWLSSELDRAKSRGMPIIALMHRPLWRYKQVQWETRVQPLLERAGADAVIAGHFHSMQRDADVGGVQYHILGTCGGMIDQPPLAGQLQHLTFVDIVADGTVRVWHQPVGLALPHDFVRRQDQDVVHALREPKPAVRAAGTVADPSTLTAPTRAIVSIEARNPTDVPITVTLDPPGLVRTTDGSTAWWTRGRAGSGAFGAGANGWTSHTMADVHNEHTMSTAAAIVAPGSLELRVPPKGQARAELPLTVMPARGPVLPPQLDLYATFEDSRGRTVPVYLPTRVPIARTVPLAGTREQAPPFPAVAWDYSPYDTREANPELRAWREGDAMVLEVDVPDDALTGAPQWSAPDAARMRDPAADAVRVVLRTKDAVGRDFAEEFLYEPFTAGCTLPNGARATSEVRTGGPRGPWKARLAMPLAGRIPTGIQVGVADNDRTYHTQWRWLAPGGAEGWWPVVDGPAATAP